MTLFSIIVTWMLVNLWVSLIALIAMGDMLSGFDELPYLFLASVLTLPIWLGILKIISYIYHKKRKRGFDK